MLLFNKAKLEVLYYIESINYLDCRTYKPVYVTLVDYAIYVLYLKARR